jgi:hypothetical protein
METSIGQRPFAGNGEGPCNTARRTAFSAVAADMEELSGRLAFFAVEMVVSPADSRGREAQSPSVPSDRFRNELRMSARPPERRLSRLTTATSLR